MRSEQLRKLREERGIVIDEAGSVVLMPMSVAVALEAYVQGDHFDADAIGRFTVAMEGRPRPDDEPEDR